MRSYNLIRGEIIFDWLDAAGRAVDSGNSVATFDPAAPRPPEGTPEFLAFLAAAIAAPPAPPRPTVFDYAGFVAHCDAAAPGFVDRVLAAARVNVLVARFVNEAVARDEVSLASPRLASALAAFVAAGLMTEAERTAILTP